MAKSQVRFNELKLRVVHSGRYVRRSECTFSDVFYGTSFLLPLFTKLLLAYLLIATPYREDLVPYSGLFSLGAKFPEC